MTPEAPSATNETTKPVIDEQGVDRVQIRRMLDMTPIERLAWLEEFMRSLAELRERNAKRQIR